MFATNTVKLAPQHCEDYRIPGTTLVRSMVVSPTARLARASVPLPLERRAQAFFAERTLACIADLLGLPLPTTFSMPSVLFLIVSLRLPSRWIAYCTP